jgi:hypothetical protein
MNPKLPGRLMELKYAITAWMRKWRQEVETVTVYNLVGCSQQG